MFVQLSYMQKSKNIDVLLKEDHYYANDSMLSVIKKSLIQTEERLSYQFLNWEIVNCGTPSEKGLERRSSKPLSI